MYVNVPYMEGMESGSSLLLQRDKYDSKIPPPTKKKAGLTSLYGIPIPSNDWA